MNKNDNDNIEDRLRPVEKHILQFAKAHPGEPFCWREFASEYAYGTIRNALSALSRKNLIDLEVRSTEAFYVLHSTGETEPVRTVTTNHMGGKYNIKRLRIEDYERYLDSFGWEEVWKVHDVVLCLSVKGLYDKAQKTCKYPVNSRSKDIQFPCIYWQKYRSIKVILHRTGTVSCHLRCSTFPVDVTPEGLVELSAFLGKVQTRLEDAMDSSCSEKAVKIVPDVSTWVVTQWHFGKDGKKEISGKSLNVTYKTWSGALVRIYLKKHGKKLRARKEVIEKPRKTLPRAFSDKMVSEIDESTNHR